MTIYQEVTPFPPTYLYIKQHTVTGLLYFGKSTQSQSGLLSYNGSGSYWFKHLKKHGKEYIETVWYSLFYDKESIKEFALMCSKQWDIVNAKNEFGKKIWANLQFENGLDGTTSGTTQTEEHKQKGAKSRIGLKRSEETKLLMSSKAVGKVVSSETRELQSMNAKDKVIAIDLASNKKIKIDKTEFDRYKGIKYVGIEINMVVAINLETSKKCKVSKEEFELYKGRKYVGVTNGIVRAFNIITKTRHSIPKEEFDANKYIIWVGINSKIAKLHRLSNPTE